ncbi:MAG: hypothetical protein ACPGGJ_03675, partial [Coraliomargarita sp.]
MSLNQSHVLGKVQDGAYYACHAQLRAVDCILDNLRPLFLSGDEYLYLDFNRKVVDAVLSTADDIIRKVEGRVFQFENEEMDQN